MIFLGLKVRSNQWIAIASVLLAWMGLGLCMASAVETPAKLKVVVPIEPYRFLLEQIGGDSVEVMSVVPGNSDPHHYAATGKQMKFVAEADLYFSIQLPFEMQIRDRLLETSGAEIVDLVQHQEASEADHEDHDSHEGHLHSHDHDHGDGIDPHVWTDPIQVMEQIVMIRDVLSRRMPAQLAIFDQRAEDLVERISEFDERFRGLFEKITADHVLVYHPAWGHFCERYGLHQVSLEREGKPIAAKAYAETLRSLNDAYFPVVLVQPQVSERLSRQVSKQVGFEIVEVDPLAYDYLGMLESMYRGLSGAESKE